MNVYYRDPLLRDFDGAGNTGSSNEKRVVYKYILELDSDDNIIGGEWGVSSYRAHPDFLWMPFEPAEPTGSRGKGNPMVKKNEEVISMWAESLGFDERNPFINQPKNVAFDIRFYPNDTAENWGAGTGYYQVLLNGVNSAFTYLEDPTEVTIDTSGKVEDGAQLRAYLNGKLVASKKVDKGKVQYLIRPVRGINEMTLKWSKASVAETSLDWTYYILSN